MELCIEKRGMITKQHYLTTDRVELSIDLPLAADRRRVAGVRGRVAGGETPAVGKFRDTMDGGVNRCLPCDVSR